jgi:hypothetical protein
MLRCIEFSVPNGVVGGLSLFLSPFAQMVVCLRKHTYLVTRQAAPDFQELPRPRVVSVVCHQTRDRYAPVADRIKSARILTSVARVLVT